MNGNQQKKMPASEHLFFVLKNGEQKRMLLRSHWHHKECVVSEANEREEHEAKKDVQIGSFRQIHVAEGYEEGSQAKENQ